jgi:hypothetical protein
MEPAAGIIPYIRTPDNKIYFLLGKEKNKWSGFVGGYETSDINIINTAIREFNEETATVFQDDLNYIKNKILSGDCSLIPVSTKNRLVYIWFIKFPYTYLVSNLENTFQERIRILTDPHYKEKSEIKWLSLTDIRSKNCILFKLKEVILMNHFRMK